MQPVHPIERLDASLRVLLVAFAILLATQYLLGHWDAILAASVDWFPLWHWGG